MVKKTSMLIFTFSGLRDVCGGNMAVEDYTSIYNGASSEYSPGIEIKRFKGRTSLRRRLSLANDLSIAEYVQPGLSKTYDQSTACQR